MISGVKGDKNSLICLIVLIYLNTSVITSIF